MGRCEQRIGTGGRGRGSAGAAAGSRRRRRRLRPAKAPGGGAVVVKQSLCKISVGRTLADGTDEVFTFDCSTVLTPSVPAVSTLKAKATGRRLDRRHLRNTGFACIINRQPIGGGFVCTTNSRTVVDASGRGVAELPVQAHRPDLQAGRRRRGSVLLPVHPGRRVPAIISGCERGAQNARSGARFGGRRASCKLQAAAAAAMAPASVSGSRRT